MYRRKAIAIIVVCFVISLTACTTTESNYRIFENISECEKIEANMAEDATITKYRTPEADQNLKDLSYNAFLQQTMIRQI